MTAELFCIGCAIKEAITKLQAMTGGKFFTIRMALTHQHSGDLQAEWQVYNGITESIQRGSTLAAAVNATLVSISDHAYESRDAQGPSPR